MTNNLAVKVTADVTDLQVKFAVARAEVNGLTTEMNKLARASAAGVIDSAGAARLQQLAGDLIQARGAASQYAAGLAEAGVQVAGFGSRVGEAHGSISTATREFRALFDELSSGRTRQTPGTLAIIAQRVLGLSPAALLAVGGVGALAAALGFLVEHSAAASNALDLLHTTALRAGNDVGRTQFQQLIDQLSQLPGVSASAAREIVSALAGVPNMTFEPLSAAARLAAEEMRRSGEDADKVGEQFAKAFAPGETATQLAKNIAGLTQAQIDAAQAADRSGSSNEVMAAKLGLLSAQADRSRGAVSEYTRSWGQAIARMATYVGGTQAGMSLDQVRTQIVQEQTKAWDANAAAIARATQAEAAQQQNPTQQIKAGVVASDEANPLAKQLADAQAHVQTITAGLSAARAAGDQVNVDRLAAGLTKARENLADLQFGPVLERMRDQMAQVAATWDGTQSGLLAKQEQITQQFLAQTQAGSKQYLAIQQEMAGLDVRERQAAGEEVIANARTQIASLGATTAQGTVQRLEAERSVWQQVLAGDQLTAAQRVQVQRSLGEAMTSIARETAAQQAAIARSDADSAIAIARLTVDAEKDALTQQIAANRGAAAEKYKILKDLTTQEAQLDEQRLQNELATLQNDPVEYERVYNQIRELKAKLNVDLAALDEQAAAEAKREANEKATAWRSAVGEIESAEGTLVSNLINRRKSLSQSLLQIGSNMLTQEITNDLKAMTQRLLISNEGAAAQKATEQGGFVYHELMQLMQTNATQTSQAAQTAAVITGNSARSAATAAATASGRAEQAAIGGQTVMADAAKAFSGAYASAAQIPYVGWILAPAAGAAAYAAVAAYEGLASLDTGTAYVPQDMIAQIHEGEAVLPKPMAQTFRENGLGGLGGADSGGGGDTHLHFNVSAWDGASVEKFLKDPSTHRMVARHLGVSKTTVARGSRL